VTARPYPETILVVDDTEFMIKILEDIFSSEGYRVHSARTGEEALSVYETALPDLVTLDVVMPGLDGIAVLSRLQANDPACRVIMVSAVGLEAKVMEALQMGARNYVLKPFDRDKVLDVVRRVLDEY
jgi:two-component system chemotaxis response regulator CheY